MLLRHGFTNPTVDSDAPGSWPDYETSRTAVHDWYWDTGRAELVLIFIEARVDEAKWQRQPLMNAQNPMELWQLGRWVREKFILPWEGRA